MKLKGISDHQPRLSYVALGDSYTIGEGAPPNQSFPIQLTEQLRAGGFHVEAPTIVAKTGWTTDELLHGILSRRGRTKSYNLVTLLIGVNNQYRGRPLNEFQIQFGELLDKAIQLAHGDPRRVIVLSIPDWSVTPFAEGRDRAEISRQIDAFNEAARAICETRKIFWVDITQISRLAERDPTLLAPDGLHPSSDMYALWVKEMLPKVRRALSA